MSKRPIFVTIGNHQFADALNALFADIPSYSNPPRYDERNTELKENLRKLELYMLVGDQLAATHALAEEAAEDAAEQDIETADWGAMIARVGGSKAEVLLAKLLQSERKKTRASHKRTTARLKHLKEKVERIEHEERNKQVREMNDRLSLKNQPWLIVPTISGSTTPPTYGNNETAPALTSSSAIYNLPPAALDAYLRHYSLEQRVTGLSDGDKAGQLEAYLTYRNPLIQEDEPDAEGEWGGWDSD
ncbi:hypothetical protein JCM10213_007553 [Rhodosporidiobolus nylandii]